MAEDKPQPFKTPQTGELWGKLKPLVREKRHGPTLAENVLWQRLRRQQMAGFQFRRQHAIDIAAFLGRCLISKDVRLIKGIQRGSPGKAGRREIAICPKSTTKLFRESTGSPRRWTEKP